MSGICRYKGQAPTPARFNSVTPCTSQSDNAGMVSLALSARARRGAFFAGFSVSAMAPEMCSFQLFDRACG